MKKILITHQDKDYEVEVTLVEAYSSGYFIIEWEDKTLQEIQASPIYMEYRNGSCMVLPPSRNVTELTFFTSIAQGIFLDFFKNQPF